MSRDFCLHRQRPVFGRTTCYTWLAYAVTGNRTAIHRPHKSRMSFASGLHSSRTCYASDAVHLLFTNVALPAPVKAVAGWQIIAQLRQHLRAGRA